MRQPTVLITGGTKGLGRLFAEALAARGARLAITGRDRAALDETREYLLARGFDVLVCEADVLDRDAARDVTHQVIRKWGRLDVLVNNAVDGGPVGPSWQVDLDDWARTQQVNVVGALTVAQAALAVMIPAGRGRIINVVSPAGVHRWPYVTAYSVSKAALIKLSENLAAELRSSGIAVVAYSPGLVDAGLTRNQLEATDTDDPWLNKIRTWARKARDDGRFTPLETATSMLVRLATGDVEGLSGQVVHAELNAVEGDGDRHATSHHR